MDKALTRFHVRCNCVFGWLTKLVVTCHLTLFWKTSIGHNGNSCIKVFLMTGVHMVETPTTVFQNRGVGVSLWKPPLTY